MNKISRKEKYLIATTAIFFVLSLLSVWFLSKNIYLTTIVLVVLAVIEMNVIASKKIIAMYLLCAIGGAFMEAISIYLGNWQYSYQTFFHIPLWLMPAWGNAGIFIISFYKLLGKIKWFQKEPSKIDKE